MQPYSHPGAMQDPYGQHSPYPQHHPHPNQHPQHPQHLLPQQQQQQQLHHQPQHQQQQRHHQLPPPPPLAGPPPNQAGPSVLNPGTKRKAAHQQPLLNDEDEDEKPNSDTASVEAGGGGGGGSGVVGATKGKGGASEFVKKLYRMLEDGQFADVVSWGVYRDSFVVKDMNQFTTHILPLHFKHSNFASFVRQLNKYDFHKVKNAEEGGNGYGDNTWEFKHPNFRADMKDSLENIKRKAPAAKKQATGSAAANRARSAGTPNSNGLMDNSHSSTGVDVSALQQQLDGVVHTQQAMQQHMSNLSADYQAVIGEMMNFQRNMVAQDQLMQNIIQYLVNLEVDQKSQKPQDSTSPFVPSSQAQKLITSYTEVARASYDQMADLSRRASLSGGAFPPLPMPPPPPSFDHFNFGHTSPVDDRNGPPPPPTAPRQQAPPPNQQQQQSAQQQHSPSMAHFQHNAPPTYDHPPPPPPASGAPQQQQQQQQQQARPNSSGHPGVGQRRESNVPGWAIAPRVLLVEDDSVCRKLSSKFLEVFGCQIDVAVDGVSAVNKMKMQKYDLVLMDIVMPNLDGVSATSMIRQFDSTTPIVSMTSNSGPDDIMTYFSHGMNDVLPKPFTKENLRGMLDRHLPHLKLIQQLAEVPRALGFSTDQVRDAVAQSVFSANEQQPNPFQSMGISDSDYIDILTSIATNNEGAQKLEVENDGGNPSFRTLGGQQQQPGEYGPQ